MVRVLYVCFYCGDTRKKENNERRVFVSVRGISVFVKPKQRTDGIAFLDKSIRVHSSPPPTPLPNATRAISIRARCKTCTEIRFGFLRP